jgi:hypothetical protein
MRHQRRPNNQTNRKKKYESTHPVQKTLMLPLLTALALVVGPRNAGVRA